MAFSGKAQFQGHVQLVSSATAALTPGAVSGNTVVTATITVPGAQMGNEVSVTAPVALGNIALTAEVTAANTVTLKFHNCTAGSLTPPATNYTAVVYAYDPVIFT